MIARSTYYYNLKHAASLRTNSLALKVQRIYEEHRRVYGCRKIRALLCREGIRTSKRRIRRIMKQLGLESAYGRCPRRVRNRGSNQTETENLLRRQSDQQPAYHAVVSDLTYVKVGSQWHYICILLDLHNREILGCSAGPRNDAELVMAAFAKVTVPLNQIQIFHTDRGSEFDNQLIEQTLEAFRLQRSLRAKACPYDNAVAEATFKIIKSEFVWRQNSRH